MRSQQSQQKLASLFLRQSRTARIRLVKEPRQLRPTPPLSTMPRLRPRQVAVRRTTHSHNDNKANRNRRELAKQESGLEDRTTPRDSRHMCTLDPDKDL